MSEGIAKELLRRLDELRVVWCNYAEGIESTHGEDDPGAKAYRVCVRELYRIIHYDDV